ncbi:DUF4260 family protein [Streptomyces sp. NPDC052299]|uniref:DUF4260 family protein n=1 Tax=Streptomyces sp. NPDC052299 TaxID=3155054 RepID=UPI003435B88B
MPGYNLVHRTVVPLLWLSVCVVLPDPPGTALFTFRLAWLLHIAVDRVLGYGLRTAEGRQR